MMVLDVDRKNMAPLAFDSLPRFNRSFSIWSILSWRKPLARSTNPSGPHSRTERGLCRPVSRHHFEKITSQSIVICKILSCVVYTH